MLLFGIKSIKKIPKSYPKSAKEEKKLKVVTRNNGFT